MVDVWSRTNILNDDQGVNHVSLIVVYFHLRQPWLFIFTYNYFPAWCLVSLRCSKRAQPRRHASTVMWTTTWSPLQPRKPTPPAGLSAGLAGEAPSMDVSGTQRKTLISSLSSVYSLKPVTSTLQRQPIMTGVRRSPMAVWRRQRTLSCPPALPEPPFLGPSSPPFSTSSHQLKLVSRPCLTRS